MKHSEMSGLHKYLAKGFMNFSHHFLSLRTIAVARFPPHSYPYRANAIETTTALESNRKGEETQDHRSEATS